MPFTGLGEVVDAPPLVPAPTGLLRSATVVNMPVPANLPGVYAGTEDPTGGIGVLSTGGDEAWLSGTRFSPESDIGVTVSDLCTNNWYQLNGSGLPALNTSGTLPSVNGRRAVRNLAAFEVTSYDTCSAIGYSANDYAGRALRALLVQEQTAVEAEFETAELVPSNGGLADGTRIVTATTNSTTAVTSAGFLAGDVGLTFKGPGIPTGTTILSVVPATSAVLSVAATSSTAGGSFTVAAFPSSQILMGGVAQSPAVAFALLQEVIARAKIGQGMIHCTAFMAERWDEVHGIRFDTTGRLTSANGNLVVAGNGYQGFGPDYSGGDVSAQGGSPIQWAYATEMVRVRRSAVPTIYPDPNDYRAALNRGNDTVTFRATRPYVVEWGRLLSAAVKIAPVT